MDKTKNTSCDEKTSCQEPMVLVDENGARRCYLDGQLHCENGPAVLHENGNEKWYYKGLLHRDDGPAITTRVQSYEGISSSYAYYKHGQLHRAEFESINRLLPAIKEGSSRYGDTYEYYLDGIKISMGIIDSFLDDWSTRVKISALNHEQKIALYKLLSEKPKLADILIAYIQG